ncbi:3175_t:CDS:2 [Paraglomus occultum]|uniref:3175_t:CDS:1 n=1 Tax=Paraglomus occultum TaxID=144539 RepID=A0A9N9ALY1_9GLOM|nr:3175_t:CDS:2 [Paraglomus occultum]
MTRFAFSRSVHEQISKFLFRHLDQLATWMGATLDKSMMLKHYAHTQNSRRENGTKLPLLSSTSLNSTVGLRFSIEGNMLPQAVNVSLDITSRKADDIDHCIGRPLRSLPTSPEHRTGLLTQANDHSES